MNIFDLYLDKIIILIKKLNKDGSLELPESLNGINVDIPPSNFDCDISTNVAMVLSKANKKSPIDIANILIELIKNEGFKCIGILLVGNSVKEISRYAAKVSADLIVIGHKHQDSVFGRWWARSTSSNLVEEAPCNVLIVIT